MSGQVEVRTSAVPGAHLEVGYDGRRECSSGPRGPSTRKEEHVAAEEVRT